MKVTQEIGGGLMGHLGHSATGEKGNQMAERLKTGLWFGLLTLAQIALGTTPYRNHLQVWDVPTS